MINSLLRRLFSVNFIYSDLISQRRARAVISMASLLTGLAMLFGLLNLFSLIPNSDLAFGTFAILVSPVVWLGLYALIQNGFLRVASWLIVGTLLVLIGLRTAGGITLENFGVLIPVIIAGVLLNWRGTLMVALISAATIIQGTFGMGMVQVGDLVAGSILVSLIITTYALIFISRSTDQLINRYISEVSRLREAVSMPMQLDIETDERTLFEQARHSIRHNMGYEVVRIFLYDVHGNLSEIDETASYSPASANAIAEAYRLGEVVLVSRETPEVRRRHLIPGMVAGAAYPLFNRDEIIGVLDVQSEDAEAFSDDTSGTLEAVTAQISSALVYARRLAALRADLQEQQAIVEKQRTRLQMQDERERRQSDAAWREYMEARRQGVLGWDVRPRSGDTEAADTLPAPLAESLATGATTLHERDNTKIISIPIRLREQTLGAISLTLPAHRIVSRREMELLDNVMQRLGIALENRRLVEQSQSQAEREARANEIGNLLLGTTDMQRLLELAAQNFNDVLGAIQTQVHLEPLSDVAMSTTTSTFNAISASQPDGGQPA